MDSSSDQMAEIKRVIFEKNSSITIHDVSKMFDIHLSMAIKTLEKFANQNKGRLFANYLIHWSDASDSITLRRFLIVSGDDELNYYNSSRDNIKYYVYSLSKDKRPLDLVFSKLLLEPNPDYLDKIQRLSFISNDQIGFRPIKRACIVNGSQSEKKSSIKEEIETPTKKRTGDHETKPSMKRVKRMDNAENEFDDLLAEDDYLLTEVANGCDKKIDEPGIDQPDPKKVLPVPSKEIQSQQRKGVKAMTQTSITSFFKKRP